MKGEHTSDGRAACVDCGLELPGSGSDVRLNGLFGWVLRRRSHPPADFETSGTEALFEWRCPSCARAFRDRRDRAPASSVRTRASHPPVA